MNAVSVTPAEREAVLAVADSITAPEHRAPYDLSTVAGHIAARAAQAEATDEEIAQFCAEWEQIDATTPPMHGY